MPPPHDLMSRTLDPSIAHGNSNLRCHGALVSDLRCDRDEASVVRRRARNSSSFVASRGLYRGLYDGRQCGEQQNRGGGGGKNA